MVECWLSVRSASDARRIGLVVDSFSLNVRESDGNEISVSKRSPSSIHYVGTSAWKDQSSGCVLLHGGSGDWRHYCANLHRLSKRIPLLVPDLPGFGSSDTPRDDDLESIVDPIVEVTRSLPWTEITLVGFSFGALVAAAAAVKRRPARLMLISPAGFGAHAPEMAAAREAAAQVAKASGLRSGLASNLDRIMLHRPLCHQDEPVLTMMEEMLRSTRAKVRQFSRKEMILDRLRLLDCPVSVLFGGRDPYHASVLRQRYAAISEACPHAHVETIADAAHWLMLERPETFEDVLLNFYREKIR